jgi:hypothetical protein
VTTALSSPLSHDASQPPPLQREEIWCTLGSCATANFENSSDSLLSNNPTALERKLKATNYGNGNTNPSFQWLNICIWPVLLSLSSLLLHAASPSIWTHFSICNLCWQCLYLENCWRNPPKDFYLQASPSLPLSSCCCCS